MSSSNCCFLTYIQISQETGEVVWYSHLLKNFPQFVMIHTVKGFSIVNEAEVDVFLELSCFFCDPRVVGKLISGSSAFSFSFIFISWRLITLQYCRGFYHTLTWISHRFTCVPHPEPLSHLPPHPIPLGHPRLYGRRSGWDDLREEYRNMYIIKCETDRQSRLDAWDKCSEIYILLSKLYTWKSVHFIAN